MYVSRYLCSAVDSESTIAQLGILIEKHLKICHLQWNIAFMLLAQIGFPTAKHLEIYPQKFDVDSTITQIAFFNEKELKYTICIGRVILCC